MRNGKCVPLDITPNYTSFTGLWARMNITIIGNMQCCVLGQAHFWGMLIRGGDIGGQGVLKHPHCESWGGGAEHPHF